jgi:hypothetical protein
MKPLTIGQLVRASATAEMVYDQHRKRTLEVSPAVPFLAMVVGQVVKQSGTYVPAGTGFDDGDYESAHLIVDKALTLWQVRTGMLNKPLLVRDEDLEPSIQPFVLPRRAARVKRPTYEFDTNGVAVLDTRTMIDGEFAPVWLPMDEAPHDGTVIVGLVNDEAVDMQWAESRHCAGAGSSGGSGYYGPGWQDTYNRYALFDEPTGWRPL